MARAALTVTKITRAGVAPPAQQNSDATNDHYIPGNDGTIFLEVTNVNAGEQDVTIITPGTVDGNAIADLVVPVPGSSAVRLIGPFPPAIYNQADGSVYVDPEISTDLKFRAYRVA